ncbi:MAG: hypothetical protein QOA17_10740 [Nitrososphaeraceae archaeon]|nr:hypothetical protein [Nitrososphaeraceae archaeon]MDW0174481.1 hypothetical protein [Nitrososphaeraceae archaeon]MDW0192268.1 hypothetical protein [Nitrososphaeraceae archaeon]MDW0216419.1 hypothetical protein [Nitrososphaeraceae archaeon]MDW0219221.1 hypothetical protein [Nitrososphaeraceae archaeon]
MKKKNIVEITLIPGDLIRKSEKKWSHTTKELFEEYAIDDSLNNKM